MNCVDIGTLRTFGYDYVLRFRYVQEGVDRSNSANIINRDYSVR